jgi:3',5'-nucleoside bisphosphate phosphatase
MKLAADMHVHTVLSPCASREMTPPAIVREASEKGMAVIAVCDHNTAGNVRAVMDAAAAVTDGPAVIPGIEITTVEECHVLGWFRCPADACAVSDEVASGLPPWRPLAARTGAPSAAPVLREPEQQLMDADGNERGVETLMLAAASRFTLSETVDLIHRHGGLSVAAHVDRRSFSVPGQLGFIPDDVPFDALEISAAGAARGRAADFTAHGLPLVSSSDSHFLEDLGTGFTILEVQEPTFDEIARAIGNREGRGCSIA